MQDEQQPHSHIEISEHDHPAHGESLGMLDAGPIERPNQAEHTVLYGTYASLRDKYNKLVQQYSNLQEAHNKTVAKWRAGKENIKTWRAYHERSLARERLKHGASRQRQHEPGVDDRVAEEPLIDGLQPHVSLDRSPIPSLPSRLTTASPVESTSSSHNPKKGPGGLDKVSRSYHTAVDLDEANHRITDAPRGRENVEATSDRSDETAGGTQANRLPTPKFESVAQVGRNEVLVLDSSDHSSDQPVIVSERSLRKRKRAACPQTPGAITNQTAQQDGSVVGPFKVEGEDHSSSPLAARGLLGEKVMHDSLDLDEVGARHITPRKRRRLEELLRISELSQSADARVDIWEVESNGHLTDLVDSDAALIAKVTKRQTEENMRDRSLRLTSNKEYSAPAANVEKQRTTKSDVVTSAVTSAAQVRPTKRDTLIKRVEKVFESNEQPLRSVSEPAEATPSQKQFLEQSMITTAGLQKVLQPTNSNKQLLPQTSEARFTSKRQVSKRRHNRVSDRIEFVTEDGENITATSHRWEPQSTTLDTKIKLRNDQIKTEPEVHRRLASLLDEPSPEKSLLAKDLTHRVPKSSSRSPSKSTAQSLKRIDRAKDVATPPQRVKLVPGPLLTPHPNEGPDDPLPEQEPLRARPLRRLGPEDFKVNPDYNQGLDYAFTEVVRKHDQRKCLPGCTKPDCCGAQFRKLVQIGGFPTSRLSGLWSSSPPEDANNDRLLLAAYLGEDRARLEGLSEAERREVLLDVQTRYFADKHGRHRQAYERRATPPGFWRTDMPTTQELEGDREEARAMERKRVEEMYREAMREGGRWRFRDE